MYGGLSINQFAFYEQHSMYHATSLLAILACNLGFFLPHLLLLLALLLLHSPTLLMLFPQGPICVSQISLRRNDIPHQRFESLDFYSKQND